MKKILLILFLLNLKTSTSTAQWVTIPDANFVTKLTLLYPSCMNGNQMDTTCAQIVNATTLSISYANISDLTGVQYFNNLINLYCDSNNIVSLSTFPPNLKSLDCAYNQITNLSQLPDSLKSLKCYYNQLSSLPALPSSLQILKCYNNLQLNTLPTLPNNLEILHCYYSQLTALPLLPNTLQVLFCQNNVLSNLPTLPNSLINLKCNNNQLVNLPTLPNAIEQLNCSVNQLNSLPALPGSLLQLTCSSNPLNNLPTLPVNLTNLECNSNSLTSLPGIPNSLKYLTCNTNQLTSLPSLPNTLLSLSISSNTFTNLTNLPDSLTYLSCAFNLFNSLPPLPVNLTDLYCSYNQLTSLPPIPAILFFLDCSNNQLTSLPELPNNMFMFYAQNNNISCVTNLPQSPWPLSDISNNPLTCVPNQTDYSLGLPLCIDNDPINNPFYCPGVVNIAGYAFKDLDTNCAYSTTDLIASNIPVRLFDNQNNLLETSYTINGMYSFANYQPDTFIVKIDDVDLPFSMACGQSNNISVILDSTNQSLLSNNFPLICDSAYDIKVISTHTQGLVFPGQVHLLNVRIVDNLTWYNLNCNPSNYSGTVSLSVTGPVTYISAASGAIIPQVNGNTFTYSIADFSTLTLSSFGIYLMTDTTAQAGNQICVHVEISTTPIDADTTNNIFDFCYQVVNSFDPNMKEVYPVNVLPGYDDWFTYTIHFQNTGSAPAINIRLKDTLDVHLDASTFEMLGYSHPAITSISGNVLTVRFNNIMLPDSTTDHDGSMGYFQYRIKPLPNLPLGSQIENTAYIYFDYNAPVITNTTQNNFDFFTGTYGTITKNEFTIFPNPGNGIFYIKAIYNIKTVEVFNLLGDVIVTQTNHKQINLSSYPIGIYFVRINGQKVVKLVKE